MKKPRASPNSFGSIMSTPGSAVSKIFMSESTHQRSAGFEPSIRARDSEGRVQRGGNHLSSSAVVLDEAYLHGFHFHGGSSHCCLEQRSYSSTSSSPLTVTFQ